MAEIEKVKDIGGGWTRVQGRTKDGKKVSIDVATRHIESMKQSEGKKYLERNLEQHGD
jgi:hypothetical protein